MVNWLLSVATEVILTKVVQVLFSIVLVHSSCPQHRMGTHKCVCVCVCVSVCVCAPTYMCICMRVCVCAHRHMSVSLHIASVIVKNSVLLLNVEEGALYNYKLHHYYYFYDLLMSNERLWSFTLKKASCGRDLNIP